MIFRDTRRSAAMQMDEARLDREKAKESVAGRPIRCGIDTVSGQALRAVQSGRKPWQHLEQNQIQSEDESAPTQEKFANGSAAGKTRNPTKALCSLVLEVGVEPT